MRTLRVDEVRFRATVQDLGRPGLAHLGVPAAGAADPDALRRANRLVGNDDNAAAIEVVLGGLTVTADCPGRCTVVGADWSRDGDTLRVGRATGAYAYLAVAGGVDVAPVLGSRSTDTLAGLGPPPLRAGDVLGIGRAAGEPRQLPTATGSGPIRVLLGPRDDWVSVESVARFFETDWTVLPSSDRTGLRLSGLRLDRRSDDELPSEGLVAGAVQVPPDGQPIVVLANHPTTGGYPVVGVVVAADIGRAAQHRPGASLRFARG